MTNGRGAGMAAFMTRKKKYKFQVEICLEELLEVPLITAVLFAKLRLVDGGNFQDHSSREEVRDHKVKWGAKFTFPCKMMANASTGVMERCVLRISIRKESGRSFTKLGFVDLNLAEYAGAGMTHRKALLEGYDMRRRQDNSMLQFSIKMNMLQGDILFKVPSSSLKHKQIIENTSTEPGSEEFSGGSLTGSTVSGSSGFGSLPKKRPQLLTSDLVIGQTLTENNVPVTIATDCLDVVNHVPDNEEPALEPGHSRNSSNTSQLSKASGYSSIHSHSRQSSSGDSGHIRNPSSSSLVLSETGSLDRVKPAYERRKKNQANEDGAVSGRVETTRVNPDVLIEEILKNTNLEPNDDTAETSGLKLFIASDGTAALGNPSGVQVFKQVVMDDR
ncbi:unnamed protein product [Brassicogethes aeneus]|uniref:C2 NT-type domain-containing protein n=1 Tax=Brassicogethes aeneus TaxID=1431903 RepID=A0A9P0B1U2_BRAAE|nr:unnamed protein product [Brassicogethes aeneus]